MAAGARQTRLASSPPTTRRPASRWQRLIRLAAGKIATRLCSALYAAAEQLESVPPSQVAAFLDGYADRLAGDSQSLCEQAHRETALPLSPRLSEVELPRTVNQLRLAAEAAQSESWRSPVCDQQLSIASCYGPLGPALVFGPNNFPFAFNAISGGDFAAAIAAGNPVIAKGHPAHAGTCRLLAELAQAAANDAKLPPGSVQMLYSMSHQDGLRMVADPRLAAVAFTGGRPGGLALKGAADALGKPIYLEMSSVNPVFLLPGAVAERGEELAGELAGSCLMGAGQFCTCPNLVVLVEGDATTRLLTVVQAKMEASPPAPLLARGVVDSMQTAVAKLRDAGAEVLTGGEPASEPGYRFQNTLLRVSGAQFLSQPDALQTEAFGPATLAVVVADEEQAIAVSKSIEGSLTATVYSAADGADNPLCERLMRELRRRVGRLINDKMPTGVAVSPAMNHGGPFPATGHPGFTAVGIPASIRRFTKLDCYDNVRPERLPACLRNPSEA